MDPGAVGEKNPLATFVRLSRSVYLREPVATDESSDDGELPMKTTTMTTTIVLAFWMNAPARALVKYVNEYARRAPAARIIFILSSSSDFFLRSTRRAQQGRLTPAVEAIRTSTTATSAGGSVFVHLFSNGGLFTVAHLFLAYHRAAGHAMPISSMMIDSAPGRASFTTSRKALSFALPPQMGFLRFFGIGTICVVLTVNWLWRKIRGVQDSVSFARTVINDPDLVRIRTMGSSSLAKKRCYIYSETDDLIPWQDVERHATESEAAGWVVRREKFVGSPHVGHMRVDPDRYWGIIEHYLYDRYVASWPEGGT